MIEVFFTHSMVIALSPGVAIECRGGEVVALEEGIVRALMRSRPGGVEIANSKHTEMRRRPRTALMIAPDVAKMIAPPLDDYALIRDAERAATVSAARRALDATAQVTQ